MSLAKLEAQIVFERSSPRTATTWSTSAKKSSRAIYLIRNSDAASFASSSKLLIVFGSCTGRFCQGYIAQHQINAAVSFSAVVKGILK